MSLNPKAYCYVGPETIRQQASQQPPGVIIHSLEQIEMVCQEQEEAVSGMTVLTFVVDQERRLRLAPRRSEHVACAGGEPVLCAGEIWIQQIKNQWEVSEVSNQSLGYCPEPESWGALEKVLDDIEIEHPGDFTLKIIFRRCSECGQTNVVKDGWLFCLMCEAELPEKWNFQD